MQRYPSITALKSLYPTTGAKITSAKLQAFTFLKSVGLIERATDARYLGCHGGDHFFGLTGGDICAVDLVTRTVKSGGVVVIWGAK